MTGAIYSPIGESSYGSAGSRASQGRTYGIGTNTYGSLNQVANSATFIAKLISNLSLTKGTGTLTDTRAGATATVVDFEGNVKTVPANCARFTGARFVWNLFASSDVLATQGITTVAGTHVISFSGTGTIAFSGTATGSLVGDGVNRKAVALTTTAGTLTCTVTGSVLLAQAENVTNQSNQAPASYVPSTEMSAGAAGCKYFEYLNGNTVINNVVTEAQGAPIGLLTTKYAYNCIANGDYFSTPSSATNRVTGDICLTVDIAPTLWIPTATQTIASKDSGVAAGRSWSFNLLLTSGFLRFNYSLDGTNMISITSSVATGFANGTRHHVMVERTAADGSVRFYTSEDGVNWTQLGTTQTGTAGAIFDSATTAVLFGARTTGTFVFDGRMYESEIWNGLHMSGVGATLASHFNPNDWVSGATWTDRVLGEIWTTAGNALIYPGATLLGYLSEAAATNLVWPSGYLVAGVTQTTAALTAASYTLSFKGTGSVTGTGGFIGTLNGTGVNNKVQLTVTGSAAAAVLTVTGSITEMQLELGSFATSNIPTTTAAVTRNADLLTESTADNIAAAQGTMYGEFIPNHATAVAVLWGTYVDANNYTQVLHDGTKFVFRRMFGGTLYDATFTSAYVSGTTYKWAASWGALGSTIYINGVAGTPNASTTAIAVGATMQEGANGVGGQQPAGQLKNRRNWQTNLPNATLQALTAP